MSENNCAGTVFSWSKEIPKTLDAEGYESLSYKSYGQVSAKINEPINIEIMVEPSADSVIGEKYVVNMTKLKMIKRGQ